MTYPEANDYLNSLVNYEKKTSYSCRDFKLQRMRDFLGAIGDPQRSLRIIHVAGSKGKGSTCAFVAYILRSSGFRCGLYTSPHLKDFRERIRILEPGKNPGGDFEGSISQRSLARLVEQIKPAAERFNRASKYGPLSFFEFFTALALLYFKSRRADIVVLETGLGGRLDATNAASSLVCAITPLSLEHTDKLGATLEKIAGEKSGIIKQKGSLVLCAPQLPGARRVIRERCKKFNARLFEVGRQIKYSTQNNRLEIKGLNKTYRKLKIGLLGEHQGQNAALSTGIIEALGFCGITVNEQAIRRGLAQARWPGRCEITGTSPLVILDGAQNAASAKVLSNAIRNKFGGRKKKYGRLILVLGVSADKDIPGICRVLEPLADRIILTCADTPRAAEPERLALYLKKKHYLTQSVKEAKLLAAKLAEKNDLILVTGSLFVVGEYRDVGR